MNKILIAIAASLMCTLTGATAEAEKTAIDVRVISKGAKFIGTSMGGVEIMIRDAATGKILDRGKTSGTTGDTDKIMREDVGHHEPVSTPDAAVFHAVVNIDEPRQIEVTARGPLGQPQAVNVASVTQWIVPGLPVTGGDGLLLELPGFVVDVLDPPAHSKLAKRRGLTVPLRANVCMMCGCPVVPGGLWDAEQFQIAAIVYRDGKKLRQTDLVYAGDPSQFQTSLQIDKPGAYEVVVYAHDPANGNTGLDKTTFIVTE